jgi:phospholipid-binding lipoprotein MlaA
MGLPEHDEDFGQTLGYWGVGEGYYLVLPLLGPSTTRDVWGVPVDGFYLDPVSRIPSTATRLELRGVDLVNMRANFLRTERAFADAQVDPYSFQRQTYLQRRRDLVYDGNPPKLDLDFESPP